MRRRLRPEEIELWRKVSETTHRLHPDRLTMKPQLPKPKPTKPPLTRHYDIKISQLFGANITAKETLPCGAKNKAATSIQMDSKAYRTLIRGKTAPEGKLDLHGMTLDEAHPELTSFILRAHRSGKRLLLVITGKGRISEPFGKRGVLKQQVPQWLALPPLAGAILQVSQAHIKHGGSGAIYVYLRRAR